MVNHFTNESICHSIDQAPLSKTIGERQLNFTGHRTRMPKHESANRFFMYESKIKFSLRQGAQRTKFHPLSYLERKLSASIKKKELGLVLGL